MAQSKIGENSMCERDNVLKLKVLVEKSRDMTPLVVEKSDHAAFPSAAKLVDHKGFFRGRALKTKDPITLLCVTDAEFSGGETPAGTHDGIRDGRQSTSRFVKATRRWYVIDAADLEAIDYEPRTIRGCV